VGTKTDREGRNQWEQKLIAKVAISGNKTDSEGCNQWEQKLIVKVAIAKVHKK
jgi:hypothetical protein